MTREMLLVAIEVLVVVGVLFNASVLGQAIGDWRACKRSGTNGPLEIIAWGTIRRTANRCLVQVSLIALLLPRLLTGGTAPRWFVFVITFIFFGRDTVDAIFDWVDRRRVFRFRGKRDRRTEAHPHS